MVDRSSRPARALAHESRVAILHVLQQAPRPLGVHEVAPRLGLQRTTTRDHLEHLVAAGYVAKAPEARATRGRPRILYRALERPTVPFADPWFRANLGTLLRAGYARPRSGRSAAAVSGEAELTQLAAIETHLEELGFEPELDPHELRIHLRRCPFLDLAREHTDVVCSVHLDLARGVLAQHDGPLTADRLEPFVGPHHCVLHLGRRAVEGLVI